MSGGRLRTYTPLSRSRPLRAVPSEATVTDLGAYRHDRQAIEDARRIRAEVRAGLWGAPVRPAPEAAPDEEDRFPPGVRALILARPKKYGRQPCELAGWLIDCWGQMEAHHRRNTGMGGSTGTGMHVASNGVAACSTHHAYIHHSRERAQPLGLLLSKLAVNVDPRRTPVSFDGGETFTLLTNEGDYELYVPPEGAA